MGFALLENLPPLPDTAPDRKAIQELIRSGAPKLVVLDDDPTGTQTVYDIDVLAEWSEESLSEALADAKPAFYILTNSRSLSQAEAIRLNREIARNLAAASRRTGRPFAIASRSDSTLRGHFPAETDVWLDALTDTDALVLIPAFFEGGRYTVHNTHYVAEGARLVPAAETEYAKDATFGYRSSDLTAWIEEKTAGRIRAASVETFGIEFIRKGGADGVYRRLCQLAKGAAIVVNAAAYGDLEIVVHGLMQAEKKGKLYLFRTAAGFVRVRAGLEQRPFLPASAIVGHGKGGLVFVGSYVGRTTQQLESALEAPGAVGIEIKVDALAEVGTRSAEISRVAHAVNKELRQGSCAIVYTSRKLHTQLGRAGDISVAQQVSSALVETLRRIEQRPRFLIAKGGITASDLAVKGLGMRRARVIGQAAVGVPVWRMEKSLFPGLNYVVFPGNVGAIETLRHLIERLSAPEAGPDLGPGTILPNENAP